MLRLSAIEEKELGYRIRQGDLEARDKLIISGLRRVQAIARNYLGRGLDREDLEGEGTLGLIKAAENFDPDSDNRFSTYSSFWIRQSIRIALARHGSPISLSYHIYKVIPKYREAERKLYSKLGRQPDFEEVCDLIKLKKEQRPLLKNALARADFEIVEGTHYADDEGVKSVEIRDEVEKARKNLSKLDPNSRRLVDLYCGGWSVKEIAMMNKMKEEEVDHKILKAVMRLR